MSTLLHTTMLTAVRPALAILPLQMDTLPARVMLLAIGLQESRLTHRRQLGNGPARGLWQFEQGSQWLGGGVWGVFKHKATRFWVNHLCTRQACPFDAKAIYNRLEFDDVLAAGMARLLLFAEASPLPAMGDAEGAWVYYAEKTWRPGKPHRETWDDFYLQALNYVTQKE